MGNVTMVDNEYLQMKSTLAREFRIIDLDEEFNEISCYKVRYYLEKIEQEDRENGVENPEPITIRINSYGGAVHELNSILNVIERLEKKGYQINTHCEGKAMSCGAFLLAHGSKGHRTAGKYSTILIHQMSYGARGTASEIDATVKGSSSLKKLQEQELFNRTKITKRVLDKNTLGGDWYMTSEEALKYGVIDEII